MNTRYTPQFFRQYRHLPHDIRDKAKEREKVFQKDPFNPKLKTHKLSGRLREYWAFSVDFRYRIIFTFESGNLAIFHAVGDHSVYI